MKTKEPIEVIQWRQLVAKAQDIPKCCHTCDEYDAHGMCLKHWATPPESFTNAIGACPDWVEELVF